MNAGAIKAETSASRRRVFLPFLGLVVLAGAVAAGLWWYQQVRVPVLSGEVRVAGADGGSVPAAGAGVFLLAEDDLTALWRQLLADEADRQRQREEVLASAIKAHRESELAWELAASICALAEEYNMPDAAALRDERDALRQDFDIAAERLDRLREEHQRLSAPANFLGHRPGAVTEVAADPQGVFRLELPAERGGLIVLVVAEAAAPGIPTGWLVPLDDRGQNARPVVLTPDNALDAEQIHELAGAQP